jgi:hypothetical protein
VTARKTEYLVLVRVTDKSFLSMGPILNGRDYTNQAKARKQYNAEVKRGEHACLVQRTTCTLANSEAVPA